MRWKHLRLLIALPLVACEPVGETVDPDQEYTPSTIGTVGEITFLYHCTSQWDAVCVDRLDFPSRIAAGATFDITAKGWDQGSLRVEVVGSAVAKNVPGGVQALVPGWFSYWAIAEVDGKVVDFRHLQVAEVGRLAIGILADHDEWSEGPVFGYVGQTLDVAVRPMETGPAGIGSPLAGTLGATWALEGASATLLSSGELPAAQVHLTTPGTVTITATAGELSGSTTINVLATGGPDAGGTDAVGADAGPTDAMVEDTTDALDDAAVTPDTDASADAEPSDAMTDAAAPDAAAPDAAGDAADSADTAPDDAGAPDDAAPADTTPDDAQSDAQEDADAN